MRSLVFRLRIGLGRIVVISWTVTSQHLAAVTSTHSDESFAFGLDCPLDGITAHTAELRVSACRRSQKPLSGTGTTRERKNQTQQPIG
jgi:hypothetical protein